VDELGSVRTAMKNTMLGAMVKAAALGLLLMSVGCVGAEDDRPPAPVTSTDTDTDTDPTEPTTRPSRPARTECESATVKECTIYLPARGNVQPCYPGLSVCEDGRWSDCLNVDDAEDMLESMDDEDDDAEDGERDGDD
jgi:hypothetical protein